MPNIRESLYQCLANEITATSATPTIELCKTESDAYAITIYVVYNGTSFLELNLNSGTIKSGNNYVGYYRIRQAALQENENNSLYLHEKSYYLKLSNIDVTKKIYIRKEIKFGTYAKLLSTLSDTELTNTYKLTDIKYDAYRSQTAYSNGYFVETDDHTYVSLLSPKETGYIGEAEKPFNGAYITDITTENIIVSHIGVEGDQANNIDPEHVETISAEAINADTLNIRSNGTINLDNVKFGVDTLAVSSGVAAQSGFSKSGTIEIRQVDGDHMYTKYVTVGQNTVQQLVVPGGVDMSNASGTFATATVHDSLSLSYLNRDHLGLENNENIIVYLEDGILKAHKLSTTPGKVNGTTLNFVTDIDQNEYGDITYTRSTVNVANTYSSSDSTNPITGAGVADAIKTLTKTVTNSNAYQTVTSISLNESGVLDADFGDIVIPNTKTGNIKIKELASSSSYPYTPSGDTPSNYTLSDALAQRARAKHAHGNITSDGTIYGNPQTIGNTFKFVLTDTNGNLVKSSIEFDGSTEAQYLTKKGTWKQVPTRDSLEASHKNHGHGVIDKDGIISTTANIATDYSLVLTDGAGVIARSSLKFNTSGDANTDGRFKYLGEDGTWHAIPTLIDLDGSPSGHDHRNKYIRFDKILNASSGEDTAYTTAEKENARTNIGAGTVSSVAVKSTNGTLQIASATEDSPITTSGVADIDLWPIRNDGLTLGSSVDASASHNSTEDTITFNVPYVSTDKYGRVTNTNSSTQTVTIQGHTAKYELDEDGVLTITVI